jgi:hypothetical protein
MKEIKVDNFILCLHARVVEVFATDSDYQTRTHVDQFAAEFKPDGDGAKVKIGMARPGETEIFVGAGGTRLKLDAGEWAQFQEFFAAVKAERARGAQPQ